MKVKLNSGVEYWVSWYHKNVSEYERMKGKDSFTKCLIQNQTNLEINGKGIAKLGKKEKQFNKDLGRKISLKKAMSNIGLNKETRTLFWNEYHTLTNKSQRIK